MQKQIFIIGSGRTGSKLLAELLSQGTNISKFGEVGEFGPNPIFYKNAYEGKISRADIKDIWYKSRKFRMASSNREIYLEKNHLIVPILDTVYECFPDAKFIWLRRNQEDTIRSFMNRPTYEASDLAGSYGKGRLVPKKDSLYPLSHYMLWDNYTKQQKVEWLVREYEDMCKNFYLFLPEDNCEFAEGVCYQSVPIERGENCWGELWYEELVDPKVRIDKLKVYYDWLGIEGYDEEKLEDVYKIQLGTSTEEKLTGTLPDGRKRK